MPSGKGAADQRPARSARSVYFRSGCPTDGWGTFCLPRPSRPTQGRTSGGTGTDTHPRGERHRADGGGRGRTDHGGGGELPHHPDRKSTRLNSSHVAISYAVFCLKKKKKE